MSYRQQANYLLVASGDTLSATLRINGAAQAALHFPTVDSCQAVIQGALVPPSTDVVSADYADSFGVDPLTASADGAIPVAAGPAIAPLGDVLKAYTAVRVRMTVAQTDNRTLTLMTRGQ